MFTKKQILAFSIITLLGLLIYIFISSNSRTLYVRTNTSTSNSQNGAKTFSGLINSSVKEYKEVPKFTRFRHIIISDHAIRLIYINTLQA